MDCGVAKRAGLIFLRLIVKGWRGRRTRVGGEGVALKANQIHLAALKQARVRRAMWHMASRTALRLH